MAFHLAPLTSVVAPALMSDPAQLETAAEAVCPAADLDLTLVLRAARQTHEQLEQAAA